MSPDVHAPLGLTQNDGEAGELSKSEQAARGLEMLLEFIHTLLASLEAQLAAPAPPPSLLARLRRFLTGQSIMETFRQTVRGMLRRQLEAVATCLRESVMGELQADAAARALAGEADGASLGDGAGVAPIAGSDAGSPDASTARLRFGRRRAEDARFGGAETPSDVSRAGARVRIPLAGPKEIASFADDGARRASRSNGVFLEADRSLVPRCDRWVRRASRLASARAGPSATIGFSGRGVIGRSTGILLRYRII